MQLGTGSLLALILLTLSCTYATDVKVISPSGEYVNEAASSPLVAVQAPGLPPTPGEDGNSTQDDCVTQNNIFWGSDFLSTTQTTAESSSECCKKCKLAADCTVWNWCGKAEGCFLPPNLAMATNKTTTAYKSCIWKPRPVLYAGTLPITPEANKSSSMAGWTSGIPINGTLIPTLTGFNLTRGIELDYSIETDFYCQGSTTTKSVCQLYGNAKGGAAACLNNPVCRGFQMCWSFPVWGSQFQQSAIIRMKAGLGPLNITKGQLQNPFCSVYVLDERILNNSDSNLRQYALRDAYNGSEVQQYQYSVLNGNGTSGTLAVNGNHNRRLFQEVPASGPASLQNVSLSPIAAEPLLPTNVRPSVPAPQNFTTDFLRGTRLQAFPNATFNYTMCYSNAPVIHLTIQSQLFPQGGPDPIFSIHTWTEKPFRNSGTVCCAFQDVNDISLNLQTGLIAVAQPTFVATNATLVNGEALRSYDTSPSSIVQPLVYIPSNLMNNPVGNARIWNYPRVNSSEYVNALERIFFSLSEVTLGDQFCSQGYPQLSNLVRYMSRLLSQYANNTLETAGGVPANISYVQATQGESEVADGPLACLFEAGAEYEGDTLTVLEGNQTRASCCENCWLFNTVNNSEQCDVWVLDTLSGSCELRNSTAAAQMRRVDALRDSTSVDLVSGRLNGIQPGNMTQLFAPNRS